MRNRVRRKCWWNGKVYLSLTARGRVKRRCRASSVTSTLRTRLVLMGRVLIPMELHILRSSILISVRGPQCRMRPLRPLTEPIRSGLVVTLLLWVYLEKKGLEVMKNKKVVLWMRDNSTWGVFSQALRDALLSILPSRIGGTKAHGMLG